MAKSAAMSLNLALALSLLLLISMAEGRLFAHEFANSLVSRTPVCEDAHGVESGETCFSIQQDYNLTPKGFSAVNPNLDCDKLFIGQWLCVGGIA